MITCASPTKENGSFWTVGGCMFWTVLGMAHRHYRHHRPPLAGVSLSIATVPMLYHTLYVCVYVYVCVCIYIYIYIHLYTHIYICIYNCIYNHIHTYILIYDYIYIYIYRITDAIASLMLSHSASRGQWESGRNEFLLLI